MSFKREGDDQAWLNVLKKRRVTELFALNIPDDEALLVKNGRFACLVCRHRPVFDTVATLAVHRSGKKHAADAEVFMLQKSELEELKLKRKFEKYMNGGECNSDASGSNDSLRASTASNHGLLNACVYDPRAKRRNVGPYGRKQVLNIDDEGPAETNAECHSGRRQMSTRPVDKPPQTIAEIRKHLRWQVESETPVPLKPYIGKRGFCANDNPPGFLSKPVSVSGHCAKDNLPGFLSNPVSVSGHCAKDNLPGFLSKPVSASGHCVKDNLPGFLSNPISISGTSKCTTAIKSSSDIRMNKRLSEEACEKSESSEMSSCHLDAVAGDRTFKQTQQIAKYFTAVGSGWKRDRDGTWIKDPDAEFDSDDEPPDTL